MIGKIVSLALAACALSLGAAETENWNFGWKFYYGGNPDAFKRDFDDSSWRKLDLPHDYQIEQPWAVRPKRKSKRTAESSKTGGSNLMERDGTARSSARIPNGKASG